MKKKLVPIFLLLTTASFACNFVTSLVPSTGSNSETPLPASAQADGFSAEATDEGSVLLSWEPINSAEQYLLEIKIDETFISLATLPANQTSYEDENIPPATRFTYRLSELVGDKRINSKEVSIQTKDEVGNPIQVNLEFDMSAPALGFDPNNFDPNSIDLENFDPENFDPNMFAPQPIQAEALIGPQGGEISVAGSNGVIYTLRVPPDALRRDVIITLRPISAIPDLPLSGGLITAVMVEPETLVFDIPAELEMRQPADFTAPSGPLTLAFAFEGDGQEFHLYPFPADAGQSNQGSGHLASSQATHLLVGPLADVLNLKKGGGFGTGKGTKEDVKKNLKNPPSKPQNQTEQRLAVTTMDDDLMPLPSERQLAFAKTAENIRQKAANAKDWKTFMEAVDDFSTYMNAGGDEFYQELNARIVDLLVEKAHTLLKKNQGDCLTYDDFVAQELVERLTYPKDKVSKILADRFEQKYGRQLLDDLAFAKKDCTFELSLQSTLSYDMGNSKLTATASAPKMKLFLTYFQGDIYLSGGGTMDLGVEVSGECSFPIKHYKDLIFSVDKLSLIYENGRLKDFNLFTYTVHGWDQTASLKVKDGAKNCPSLAILQGGGDFWTGMFILAREKSSLTEWKLQKTLNGLKANWSMVNNNFTPSNIKGTMIETTKFELKVIKTKK